MQLIHTTLTCMRVAVHVPKGEDHLGECLRDEVAHLRRERVQGSEGLAPCCHGDLTGSLQILKHVQQTQFVSQVEEDATFCRRC